MQLPRMPRLTWADATRLFGFAGGLHEVFLRARERPSVLVFLAGCIGLKEFVKRDESKPPSTGGRHRAES